MSKETRVAKSLGRAVSELRKEVGITRASLARAAGVSPTELQRIETSDRRDIRFTTACRLAAALETSLDELASRAGVLENKGVVRGSPVASGAAILEGLDGATALLERAFSVLATLKKRLRSDR